MSCILVEYAEYRLERSFTHVKLTRSNYARDTAE